MSTQARAPTCNSPADMSSYDLQGKTVIVTGGAQGIGFGTCEALARRGANVVIVDLDQPRCDAAVDQLGIENSAGFAADVTDPGAMQRVVSQTVERFGKVDVIIANAGIANRGQTFRMMPTETFERVLNVDLYGVIHTVRAALPQIVENKGHVVVVSSVYAFVNGVGSTPYAIAKAGVEQFGRALRAELEPHGASASVAYFGFIDTQMVHDALDNDPQAEKIRKLVPLPLRKRLKPAQAGEGIVVGIEKRAPRIIHPKRWAFVSTFRGVLNPLLDRAMRSNKLSRELVRDLDARN